MSTRVMGTDMLPGLQSVHAYWHLFGWSLSLPHAPASSASNFYAEASAMYTDVLLQFCKFALCAMAWCWGCSTCNWTRTRMKIGLPTSSAHPSPWPPVKL
eukprot:477995-Pelagomonas_calceolata.AAC.7